MTRKTVICALIGLCFFLFTYVWAFLGAWFVHGYVDYWGWEIGARALAFFIASIMTALGCFLAMMLYD